MLSLSQLREKGFDDQRWTSEDKRDQVQDVIKLHKRDKQQTKKKVEDMRERQFSEIRRLGREVQEYRGLLGSARLGDKQLLRNTLRRHRPTQLAFMEHSFEKAIEHLEQATFTLSKEMDKLRCLKKQRARQLLSLETEVMTLKREQEAHGRRPVRDAREQALISQITKCGVKQNAASSVTHTYQKILGILRKDAVYFDAVLGALQSDRVTQSRCVVRATELGQSAAEDVARLREEAKVVETDLKHSMQERAAAVKAMRAVVDHSKHVTRSHVRGESATDLRLVPAREDEDAAPLRELHRMEGVMQRLQATTLVASHLDVFPRFEAQLRQRRRLVRQVQRRQLARDEALTRRNHAHLILQELKHDLSEVEQQAELEEAELAGRKEEVLARRRAAQDARQALCTQMVSVRTALYSIVLVLNQVKPTQAMAKALQQERHGWELDSEFIDDLYARKRGPHAAPEANAMAMLKNVFVKVGVLLQQLQAEGRPGLPEVPDDVLASRAILPDVMAAKRERVGLADEEIDALVLESADLIGDAKVPTRESLKAESVKIMRMARKQSEPESYERIKRVRREEKWI